MNDRRRVNTLDRLIVCVVDEIECRSSCQRLVRVNCFWGETGTGARSNRQHHRIRTLEGIGHDDHLEDESNIGKACACVQFSVASLKPVK